MADTAKGHSPELQDLSPNKNRPPSPPAYSSSPSLSFQMAQPPALSPSPSFATPTNPHAGPSRFALEDRMPRHGGSWSGNSPRDAGGGGGRADELGLKRGSVHDQWFSPGVPESVRHWWRSIDSITEGAPSKRIAMLEKDLADALQREQAGKGMMSRVMTERDLAQEEAKAMKTALRHAEARLQDLEKMMEDLRRSESPPAKRLQGSSALRSFVARPSTASPASSFGRAGFHTPPTGYASVTSPEMRGAHGEGGALGSPLAPARCGRSLPRTPYTTVFLEDSGTATSVSRETTTFKTAHNSSTLTTDSLFLPPRNPPPIPMAMTASQSPIYYRHHLPSSLSLASPRTPYATSPAGGPPLAAFGIAYTPPAYASSPASRAWRHSTPLTLTRRRPRGWERGGYRRESERECESEWSGSSGYCAGESDRAGVGGSPGPGSARLPYPHAYRSQPGAVSPCAESSASIPSKGALLRTHGLGGEEYDWLGQTAHQRFERWVAGGQYDGARVRAEGGWRMNKAGGWGNVDPWNDGEYTEDAEGFEAGEKRDPPDTGGQAEIQHQRTSRTIPHRHNFTRWSRSIRKHPRSATHAAHHAHATQRATPRDPLLIRALRAPFILIGTALVYAAWVVATVARMWEYAGLFWQEVKEGPPGLRPAGA